MWEVERVARPVNINFDFYEPPQCCQMFLSTEKCP